MVEDWDAQKLSGFHESSSDVMIFVGWLEAAGRVVVGDNDRGSVIDDGASIYLAGVDEATVHCADGDDADRDDAMRSVKWQSEEMLSATSSVAIENLIGIRGSADSDFVLSRALF